MKLPVGVAVTPCRPLPPEAKGEPATGFSASDGSWVILKAATLPVA